MPLPTIRAVKSCDSFAIIKECPPPPLELSTLGHRIRHQRVSHGFTLDELGERVGVAGSQLSLIENGKREPKLSLLQAIATETGVQVADLLSTEPPNRRAALEIELERAQRSSVFRQLGIAPVKVTKGMSDDTIESILGLHRELQRREREAIATPEEARRANTELRLKMRDVDNYLPEIEKLAEKQLKSAGHVSGALTHRTVSIMAEQLGFELIYVSDLPHSARSVTDLENGRIYLPPASIPGGHGLRSMALQAMAHRLLGHQRPTDYADFLQQRLEINYYAACCLMPETASVAFLAAGEEGPQPRRRGLPRRVRRDARVGGDAADQPRDAASRHPAALPPRGRLGRDHPRVRERRPAAADGRHRRRRRPDRVPQVVGAVGVRRAEPHDRALPVHRHPRGHLLVLDADRHDVGRRVLDHRRACPSTTRKWFRGRETQKRAVSTCPDESCCRRPSSDLASRWQGKAWPSARVHMQMFSPLPRGAFPGVDDNEVYEFLDRHA